MVSDSLSSMMHLNFGILLILG